MSRPFSIVLIAAALWASGCPQPPSPPRERPDADDYWSIGDAGLDDPIVYPDAGHDAGTPIGVDGGVPINGAAKILSIAPSRGGASVETAVVIHGENFPSVASIEVGGQAATKVQRIDAATLHASFPPVELSQVGKKDVSVIFADNTAVQLPQGFAYWFDEDPIVFVHGFSGGAWHWAIMLDRFRAAGYPDSHLNAISFSDTFGSSLPNVQELSIYVADVLARTGAPKVDMVIHSMGGLSSRLWIKQGGYKMVRDYMSISGAHHGTLDAYLSWSDGAAEMRPIYACDGESLHNLQFILNGCLGDNGRITDADETPYGVEDGYGIAYRAIVSTTDEIVMPFESGCLNQQKKNDCSHWINTQVSWQGHGSILLSGAVFDKTIAHLRTRNRSKP